MAQVHFDPDQPHDVQAQRLLRLAFANGYGPHHVAWDPATASYDAPDEVADSFHAGHDPQVSDEVEPDDADDAGEDSGEPEQKPKGRGRRARNAASDEGAGAPGEE